MESLDKMWAGPFQKGGSQAIPNALAEYLRSLGVLSHSNRYSITDIGQLPVQGILLFETAPVNDRQNSRG